ncbi:hypothetical protein SSAG_03450 [Streptomyces sp. Mg1]|nr:hypothetical protein SSAG_03450 [Streptomyces sp. Mg1]
MALDGALHGELEHQGGLPAHQQPERRRAGDGGRVAGGGVLRLVQGGEGVVGEAGQAGPDGAAAGVEPLLAGQPAVVRAPLVGAPVALGRGPAEVGAVDVGGRVPGAGVAADVGADESVDGEEGELGGGGDGAEAAVGGGEFGQAPRAVGLADAVQGEAGDGRAEGVADGGAEEGAADTFISLCFLFLIHLFFFYFFSIRVLYGVMFIF